MLLTRREFLSTASMLFARGVGLGLGIRAGIGRQRPITLLDERWSVGGEGTTHTIDGPFGSADNLMVSLLLTNGSTIVYPDGSQTLHHSGISGHYRMTITWCVLNGTETSFVFTTEHPTDSAWAYATYLGVDPTQPFVAPSNDDSIIVIASILNKED